MVATNPQDKMWAFMPLAALGGIQFWGVSGLLVPYLLRTFGVPVDRIATVSLIASIAYLCAFFFSPLIDFRFRRRTWVLVCAIGAALCSTLVIFQCRDSLTRTMILLAIGNALGALTLSGTGALMTEISPAMQGRASGWFQAGNIGLGPLTGGMLIWLSERMPFTSLAGVVAALLFLPSLAVFLTIGDDSLPKIPGTANVFHAMWSDMRELLRSKRTWIGLAFLCSPVGTGALNSLISSVGEDYHTTATQIAWVTGLGGSAILAIGCWIGGVICDRVSRLKAYAVFGLVAAVVTIALSQLPSTPIVYAIGYASYALSMGLSFTAFSALVLDIVGHRKQAAATRYSLIKTMGDLAFGYMILLDGFGYRKSGVRGLMGVEALANGLGGLALLLVAYKYASLFPPSIQND